jgi:predicted nucleic acid-binding protein
VSHFVLDASIVLTWCFPDEESQKADAISERIAAGDRVIVTAFWRHEMLNALLVGERRKRITPDLTKAFIDDLERLPVDVDLPASSAIVFNATQALCRKHGLTAYDAAYL